MRMISGCLVAASRSHGVSPGSRSVAATSASAARATSGGIGLPSAAGSPGPGSGCRMREDLMIDLDARSNSRAPSAIISSMSWPRGTLMPASCCQSAIGSAQASTRKDHSPGPSGATCVPYRSVPGASARMISIGRVPPSGPRRTTPAAIMPCPSRNTVALTGKVSPVTALAGQRPHSTAG